TLELRANCGEEDGMSSAGTASFTTACVAITDFPYEEGFEAGLGCWTSETVVGAYDWTTRTSYDGTTVYQGTQFVAIPNGRNRIARLVSPVFNLSSAESPVLTFAHIQKIWSGDQDTLGLYYRTSAEEDWTYITSWNQNISEWTVETIDLPEPSATYQIAFLGYGDWGYGAGVDAVNIATGSTPEPVQPTVVTNAATEIAQTSATLNGAITDEGNQTITARGFEWKLATATDYTTVSATGTTMTATLTGLTANTTYTYKAFATTALGTVYGSELTFTTLEQGDEPCTPTSSTTTITACDSYEFNGQTYTTSGTYTATLVNAAGCDSTATLILTINNSNTATVEATICAGESYEFNGNTYNATGNYTATLVNAAECDSIVTLNLTVREENAPIEETVTLNNDELPYTWRGEQYSEFGTYTVTGEDENGCPQEYVLTLVHNSGIAEVDNEYSIALYPNPTTENATLSVKGLNEEATVIVTDQAGRVISTTTLALGQETMEVETTKLASGVYYIRIQTANSVRTEKLIKNN
ncbi:MAG: T9SS type A sorting domain-containing protein, partial [Synergistales bacterium]|nr:T9SS type A sorting domain-containing protein [Bacteroidales bacterium]MDY6434767.1 T9SS type A sorting domain-containing protein [Synergistales bacterium]